MIPTPPASARSRGRVHAYRALPLITATLVIAGCSLLRGPVATPTTFFVLSATAQHGEVPAGRALRLGLGPISLPPYLERPQMVRRTAPNELVFDEFNRWSEPLKENFERVLGTDLDHLVGIERLIAYPWYSTTQMDYSISIAVLRFEAQPSGEVALDARWSIGNGHGKILLNRESRLSRPGGTPEQIAGVMSELTGDLARDIAAALREMK